VSHVTFRHDTSKQTQRTPPSSMLLWQSERFSTLRGVKMSNVAILYKSYRPQIGLFTICCDDALVYYNLHMHVRENVVLEFHVGQHHLYSACTFRRLKVKWQHPRWWFWRLCGHRAQGVFLWAVVQNWFHGQLFWSLGRRCRNTPRIYFLGPIAALVICAKVCCGKNNFIAA